ncbi:anti-sigma factor family protein [Pseudonocardia sp. RS010]|uniref:anti-sigma factor family protein n=1 Tax=Pseudonocardia sp. RS010 TaxID=3385979 RepID=UPI00399F9A79
MTDPHDPGAPTDALHEAAVRLACAELVELLTDYLEGALPAHDAAVIEAHLALCPGCAAYLAQMRATIRVLGHVPVETLSPEATSILLAAFRERSGG